MNDALVQSEMLELTESREGVYEFLSAVFQREIGRESLTLLKEQICGEPKEALSPGYAVLRGFFEQKNAQTPDMVEKELQIDYAALFLSMGEKHVPPYESVYTSKERLVMQEARDQVLAEYREEGLERNQCFREPEDHIAIELEFMARLCRKTAACLRAGDTATARRYLEKQRGFLKQHLLVWAPDFCKDVQQTAKTDFYKGIAEITAEHLSLEDETIAELLAML